MIQDCAHAQNQTLNQNQIETNKTGAKHIAGTISQGSGDNEGEFETPLPPDMEFTG